MSVKKAQRVSAILALTMCVGASLALAGCGDTGTTEVTLEPTVSDELLVNSETLTVGVDTSQPPFASIVTAEAEEDEASTNEIVGFDVDVAAALADELGLKLDVIDISDTTASEALESGEVDIVMSASPASTSDVDIFVGPYVDNGPAIFGLENTSSSETFDASILEDYTVGAYDGSVAANTVLNYCDSDNLVLYDTVEDMFQALEDGEINYVAADMVSGGYVSTLYSGVECVGTLDSSSGCYIALGSSSEELSETLTTALETIDGNGVLDTVISKWCGESTVDMASPILATDEEEESESEESES